MFLPSPPGSRIAWGAWWWMGQAVALVPAGRPMAFGAVPERQAERPAEAARQLVAGAQGDVGDGRGPTRQLPCPVFQEQAAPQGPGRLTERGAPDALEVQAAERRVAREVVAAQIVVRALDQEVQVVPLGVLGGHVDSPLRGWIALCRREGLRAAERPVAATFAPGRVGSRADRWAGPAGLGPSAR